MLLIILLHLFLRCILEITFKANSRSLGYCAGLPVVANEPHDAKFVCLMPFFGQQLMVHVFLLRIVVKESPLLDIV